MYFLCQYCCFLYGRNIDVTGTAVVSLFLLHLEWTLMSDGIISLSIYNFAGNEVVYVLGLWDGCLGNEDISNFLCFQGCTLPALTNLHPSFLCRQSSLLRCHWVTVYILIAPPNKGRGADLICEAEKAFGPSVFSLGVTCQLHSASDLVWCL